MRPVPLLLLAFAIAACAGPTARPEAQSSSPVRAGPKTLTIGVTSGVQPLIIVSSPQGGWGAIRETYASYLVTSDVDSPKPIGRLAEKVPSLDDGSISVLADGRMRVVYTLRSGVSWHDGTPFTARDLVFSYRFVTDPISPFTKNDAIKRIQSVEAPDDSTFVVTFNGPYYRGGNLGTDYVPYPEHLLSGPLQQAKDANTPDLILNLPYWTSEFVHLGPFRVASYDPDNGPQLAAYDGYFLGRPKIDLIRVQHFTDVSALYASLISGTVDMVLDTTLSPDLGFQLMNEWQQKGEGTVRVKQGITWFAIPQWRPEVQMEPTVLDVRVRAALYRAMDRDALAEVLLGGQRDLAAYSLLPPGDANYEAARDGMRRYSYDPDEAKRLLAQAGWATGTDGKLRNEQDGRPFRTSLWTALGHSRDNAAVASYWRALGAEVEEFEVPPSRTADRAFRESYPGWEFSAQNGGDQILARLDGTGRGGYDPVNILPLLDAYRQSLGPSEQLQTMKVLSDFVAKELPLLVVYYQPDQLGVRSGVQAFDDLAGANGANSSFGTYSRNAYLWDLR